MTGSLDDVLETINRRERLRVWSLIVTLFGDAIVPRGGAVSARTVTLVMERLGIGEGAVRTAFSRLAADGWVIREKIGRFSYYRLAHDVADTFRDASARIYARPKAEAPTPNRWLFATRGPDVPGDFSFDATDEKAACWLIPDPGEASIERFRKRECLAIVGTAEEIPGWVYDRAAPPATLQGLRQLTEDFTPLHRNPPSVPLDAIAARSLLIHEWRRHLLRLPPAPAALHRGVWPDEAHEFVADLYRKLLPVSERWLDEHASGPFGPLGAIQDIHGRFR